MSFILQFTITIKKTEGIVIEHFYSKNRSIRQAGEKYYKVQS